MASNVAEAGTAVDTVARGKHALIIDLEVLIMDMYGLSHVCSSFGLFNKDRLIIAVIPVRHRLRYPLTLINDVGDQVSAFSALTLLS